MITKQTKTCPSCETKYVLTWNNEIHETNPITCPFCAHEIDEEDPHPLEVNEEVSETDNDSWD